MGEFSTPVPKTPCVCLCFLILGWKLHPVFLQNIFYMWEYALFCPGLSRDLQTKLHGQHLAQSVVLKAIQGFINNPESNKPLTLSFHGWSGTGKNFVARIIADNLYRDGVKSECVRLFIAPFHFPHARLVDTYKVRDADLALLAPITCVCARYVLAEFSGILFA